MPSFNLKVRKTIVCGLTTDQTRLQVCRLTFFFLSIVLAHGDYVRNPLMHRVKKTGCFTVFNEPYNTMVST